MSILDKLTHLSATKELIKAAIIAKGVAVNDEDTFRSYAEKIGNIITGGGGGSGVNNPQLRVLKPAENVTAGDIVYIKFNKQGAVSGPTIGNDPDFMPPTGWRHYTKNGHVGSVEISGDGNFVAMVCITGYVNYFITYKWNETSLRYEITLAADTNTPSDRITDIALSDDGSVLAVCGGPYASSSGNFIITYKWNPAADRYEKTADVYPARTTQSASVALKGDGTRLVIGSSSSYGKTQSYEWNETNNRFEAGNNFDVDLHVENCLSYSSEYYLYLNKLRISKDGSIIVASSGDYALYFYKWSVNNQRYERQGSSFGSGINHIALSGNGLILAVTIQYEIPVIKVFELNIETNTWSLLTNPFPFPYPLPEDHTTMGCYGKDHTMALNYDGSILLSKYTKSRNPRFMLYRWDANQTKYISDSTPNYDIQSHVMALSISNIGDRMVAGSYAQNHTFHHFFDARTYSAMAYKLAPTDQLPDGMIGIGYANEDGVAGTDCQFNLLWGNQNIIPALL